MAPDLPPVKLAINELVRSGVHVVTLFSDVAGSMRETHVGADNRAAGRTAGLLLGRMASGSPRDTLLLASQATRLSAEIERRIGFAQVIEERFPTLRMLRMPDLPADDDGDAARARALPAEERRPGARRRPLQRRLGQRRAGARARRRRPAPTTSRWPRTTSPTSIARCSANGSFAYLLTQDIHYCVGAAARVLRALCENVRGALNVVQPRVEILTAENLQ